MKSIMTAFENAKFYLKSVLAAVEKDADRLIFVPILVYTVVFSAYTCYMHYVFKTYAWDLGILEQSLWTTLNSGKILYSTPELSYGNPSGIFLGVHFSPILFVILPVYAICQSSQNLLVFQSFVLAIAALPLYWIARDKLGSKLYALAFAVAYLLNPALHGVNTFDFHVEIFTPVLILFAFYYLDKGKWLKAIPFIILELMTLEFASFIVFFLGLFFFLKKIVQGFTAKQHKMALVKKLVLPAIIMIASVCCLFLALEITTAVNPAKAGGPYRNWTYWGENFYEAIGNMVRNPTDIIIVFFTPIEKAYFLIFLLSSALFLPLLAPLELLMVLPWLLAALLSDYQPYYQPYYQYSALILGQLFIAAVYGFRRLFSLKIPMINERLVQKKMVATMIGLNIILSITISPIGISAFTNRSTRPYAASVEADLDHARKVYEVLNLIPPYESVATIHDIFPHICQREHGYFLNLQENGTLIYNVTYIIVDLKSPTFRWGIYPPTPDQIVIELLNNKEYGILASADGVLLLKRSYTGPLEYYSPRTDLFNYNQLGSSDRGFGRIIWDYTSTSKKVISSDPKYSIHYGLYWGVIWYGPFAYFAPGNYSATFKIKTTNETLWRTANQTLFLNVTTDSGYKELASRTITYTDFKKIGEWQEFSIPFEIRPQVPPLWLPPLVILEFKGKSNLNYVQIALDYIKVEQLDP